MTRPWTARFYLALLVLQLASACNSTPSPADKDTAVPSTRATPAGGTYTRDVTVSLLCDDGGGSGCAATYYTLDGSEPSRTSPTFREAIPLSASTTLKFFSVDKKDNAEPVRTEVYTLGSTGADTLPPTTRTSHAGGVYASALQVTLLCEDAGGCAATYYTLDGSTPATGSARYSTPLSISASTTLKFFSVDTAGNRESVHTERYVLDLLAPTTTAHPAGGVYNARQDVTLSCGDGVGAGCTATHYTLNGSTPTFLSPRYTEGTVLPISGNITLKFFSVDAAGNTEPVQVQTYVIDTAPPTTTASPGAGTYGGPRNVTLSCTDDAGTGCKVTYYTTNGTAPGPGSSQYEPGKPIPITANTVLRFLSVDTSGNAEPVRVLEYKIDVLPPVTTASPAGGAYNAARNVTLSCTDATSACTATYYTLDGTPPTASSSRYEGTPLRLAATTTLKFFSVDTVGNAEPTRTEAYVIDTGAPTVSANPSGGSFRTAQSVTLSCNDGTGTGCAGSVWYTTDGTEPTESSRIYSTPLSITANTTLKFFSRDAVGNGSGVWTEVYVLDSRKPTTLASPPGGNVTGTVSVTLTCDDAGGTGCNGTWYTVDGALPTTGSKPYGSALSFSTTTTLKFFSVDKVGNVEDVRTETYVFPDPAADTSAQIAAVRAAAPGSINLPIQQALVTYVKPLTGSDPAGFFLQAQKDGPALFVSVDPGTLSPSPLPGDRVSLVATGKDVVSGHARVTSLQSGSFVMHRRGESLPPLLSDASSVDLVARVEDYESEYLSVSGTLSSTFSASGTGHMQASLSTVGNPNTPGSPTSLKLRMPTPLLTALQSRYDLNQDCSVTTTGPLWRFLSTSQPSAWEEKDLQVLSCPAPRLLSVVPTSATSLAVRFDRRIRPESVFSHGGQFTFDNGLVATAASVVDNEVRLTTSAQEAGRAYTLAVAGTVQDLMGTGVDAATRNKSFFGFEKPAVLRLNEVAPHLSTLSGSATVQRDVVELYVVEPGSTSNVSLTTDNFIVATLPRVQVAAGDIIVVHLSPDTASNGDAPASETLSKSEYSTADHRANYDTAWDFHGTANGFISYSNAVLRVRDPAGTPQDAVAFAQSASGISGFPALLQALQAEALWQPAHCGGALCTYTSTPSALDVSADWWGLSNNRTTTVYRIGNADTDGRSDWTVGTGSLGLPNT
jgi:chitobiase/beta-hexosaminidase-like protein